MSNEDFVKLLQSEILPEWNQSLERLRSASGGQPQNPAIVQLLQYLQLRADAWKLIAQAVESENGELMSEGTQKWAEADQIAKQLSENQQ
ncbi:MAG: hypothetical protein ACKPJJ_25155 [Planctomycetaceae bacterium]